MKPITFIALLLLLSGCSPVIGERMIRIVETDAESSIIPFTGAEAGGVRVETSSKPLAGRVLIQYQSENVSVDYVSGDHE
ncbi:MAG: hypothetical protein RPU73_02035 [Candidatus Sedimenticola sp. (ex Thyasira tokunagai)]